MNKLTSSILVLSITAVLADFPSSIRKCKHGDRNCLTESTQEIFKTHSGGLKELNLISFDPLHVKTLELERNPNSPVNIDLKFSDMDIFGLKSAQIKYFNDIEFNKRSELEIVVPRFVLKGKYNIDGRVLILPIVGNGDTEMICKNLILKYGFELTPTERNGEIYGEIKHVKLVIEPEHIHFQFNNLFNGDKALGDNMNKFINDNWSDIFQEIGPTFAKGLSLITKQIINNVFAKYPYKTFFA